MKNNTFYTSKTVNAEIRPSVQFKDSDFFVTKEITNEAAGKKYVTSQTKMMALVLVISMIVAGAAALIVSSLAKSYSDTHKNAAVITVKNRTQPNANSSSFYPYTAMNEFD